MLPRILVTGAVILAVMPVRGESRTWRDNTGKFSVDAELVEVKDGRVILRKANGKSVTVALSRLSDADRRYVDAQGNLGRSTSNPAADKQICDLLEQVRRQSDVPAIAAAIVTSKGLSAFGIAGVRKRGSPSRVTPDDLWHLGSNTKAMTSALVGRFVERGELGWDTTLADVFSDGNVDIHPDLQSVTVWQLLSHRSGLPPNLHLPEYLGADAPRERVRAVRQELSQPPATPPGSRYVYSNLGYIVAAAIIEKRSGRSWEENMRQHIFDPLRMTSAGFGGLGTAGKIDQPWPHTEDGRALLRNGPAVDNPPVMGPAGRVHCTIQDWSRYIADVLRGVTGKPGLLKAATYRKLATPPRGGQYALGWNVLERDWAGGTVLQHSGSNTMNFATVWIAPQRDVALLACTNQGGDAAHSACDAAVVGLLEYHAP